MFNRWPTIVLDRILPSLRYHNTVVRGNPSYMMLSQSVCCIGKEIGRRRVVYWVGFVLRGSLSLNPISSASQAHKFHPRREINKLICCFEEWRRRRNFSCLYGRRFQNDICLLTNRIYFRGLCPRSLFSGWRVEKKETIGLITRTTVSYYN